MHVFLFICAFGVNDVLLGFVLAFEIFVMGFPTTYSSGNVSSQRGKWYVSRECCWPLFVLYLYSPGKHKKTKNYKNARFPWGKLPSLPGSVASHPSISRRPKSPQVVTDSDRAEFDHPMMWMRSPVHLGDFGIEQVPLEGNRWNVVCPKKGVENGAPFLRNP